MYQYQKETVAQAEKVPANVVSGRAHRLGMANNEPLIVAMDAMIRYAKAHKTRYDSPLSEDSVLGDEWLNAVKGLRGLLNGDGAVAMEKDISTDSKDNGAVEGMFWDALKIAGYKEEDL